MLCKNKQKAYELYSQSANLGNAFAMYQVGRLIRLGEVARKDQYKSCVWNYLAQRHLSSTNISKNHRDLRERVLAIVDQCENNLTENQITSAKKEALNWEPAIIYGSTRPLR